LSGAAEFDVPHQLTPAFAPVQTSDASHAMVVETPARTDLQSAVKQNEHQMILAALAATRSKTEAAEKLGISPRTLRYKMARLRERGLSLALSE
jgi:two-component system response regulator FlrC